MIPIISDRLNSNGSDKLRAFRLLTVGIAMLFAVGIALMGMPSLADESVIGLLVAVPMVMIAVAVLSLLVARLSPTPKSKRGLEGMDMYSLIDRLVEDLDEDEAAYLQRRLDERDHKPKRELSESLEALLDQREESRQQVR